MNEYTGYLIEKEEREWLEANSLEYKMSFKAGDEKPEVINFSSVIHCEDQRQRNSCCGNAKSTAEEVCWWLKMRTDKQFSRWFAYITAQMEGGGANGDNGAYIAAAVRASMKLGACPKELFPYPKDNERYSNKITPEQYEAAKEFLIKSQTKIRTYDEWADATLTNKGAFIIGIPWGGLRPDANGVCHDYTGGGGGHALCVAGGEYWQGTDELCGHIYNSHGPRWGKNGMAIIRRKAIEKMLKAKWAEWIMISDMETPEPRKIDWANESPYFSESVLVA